MDEAITLSVRDLSTSFFSEKGEVKAVDHVSFDVPHGSIVGLVGESGCGKSMLCRSIMKLLPQNARITSGSITVNGVDITTYRERDMRRLRGKVFSMIFQDPLTALDPAMPVGRQIAEAVRTHRGRMERSAVDSRVAELLALVGVEPRQGAQYPHQLSGGQRQRCLMAMALAGEPKILLADEPTTALDVTVQAQILDLLRDIQQRLHTSTILVSHDLGVVARAADRVAIMYAGRIVEIGTAEEVYYDPRHPYTKGLLRSLPALAKRHGALHTIPGMPPTLIDPPEGDAFACRNPQALAIDYQQQPPMFPVSDTHYAATWLLDPRAPQLAPLPEGEEHYV